MIADVTFSVNNIRTTFSTSSYHVIRLIDHLTSFPAKGYQFSERFRQGLWDGRIHLLYKPNLSFPTGLLPPVLKELDVNGYSYQVNDVRVDPTPPSLYPLQLKGVELREYQLEAIKEGLKQKRGIYNMVANTGKTEVAIGLTQVLGLKTLFLTHRKDLLYQTQERFRLRLGREVGVIGDGKFEPDFITIALPESLRRRLRDKEVKDFVRGVGLLICDEAHRMPAPTYYKVFQSCPAFYRFGFSGTPLSREDGRDMMLVAATGEVIYSVGHDFMIQEEFSVKPIITFYKVQTPKLPEYLDYENVYQRGVVECEERNNLIVEKVKEAVGKDKTVLVLVKLIRHGEILDSLMPKSIKHRFVWGESGSKERVEEKLKLDKKKLDALVTSTIFDEGVDIPSLDVLVLAGGGRSEIKILQRIGRGLRKSKGKRDVEVVEFFDSHHRYLLKHSLKRFREYSDERSFEVRRVGW